MGSLIAEARGNTDRTHNPYSQPTWTKSVLSSGKSRRDGFIRFAALGDWWAQVLLGQRVDHQDPPGRCARRNWGYSTPFAFCSTA